MTGLKERIKQLILGSNFRSEDILTPKTRGAVKAAQRNSTINRNLVKIAAANPQMMREPVIQPTIPARIVSAVPGASRVPEKIDLSRLNPITPENVERFKVGVVNRVPQPARRIIEPVVRAGTELALGSNLGLQNQRTEQKYGVKREGLKITPMKEGADIDAARSEFADNLGSAATNFVGSIKGKTVKDAAKKVINTVKRSDLSGMALSKASKDLVGDTGDMAQTVAKAVKKAPVDPRKVVGVHDIFRTPEHVMEKIGLGKEMKLIRRKYEDYRNELPVEIDRITQWSKRVSPESNARIFDFLDGQPVQLDQNEQQVAGEIRSYLQDWAMKLKLPQDNQISHYITHIFEPDFIQKDFDDDVAKIIADRVPGSVYDPFLEKRLGKLGYVRDTWRALDAYVKRATRKFHMDQALGPVKKASETLEKSQFDYVKSYIDRINMRPTKVDTYVDNTLKSIFGYKFTARPTANLTGKLRRAIYRGTLGLNIGSALRNLTQGVNTYSQLGEKYTVLGFTKLLTNGTEELNKVGVLGDDFIQDRTFNATKKFWENMDKGLFVFFDLAEKLNRGTAYYGAKSKALAKGMNEEQAIEYAKDIVRKTQFTFGSIDTPPILQSDIGKTFLQFQSYNVKQAEFIASMVKNKEFAGLARWAGANVVIALTVGKALGIDLKDMIPFSGVATGETKLGETPAVKLISSGIRAVAAEEPNERAAGKKDFIGTLPAFVPAGSQIKKTVEGVNAYRKGYSETSSGRVRFPIGSGVGNAASAAVLGQYSVPEAREYFDKNNTPLGDGQSAEFKNQPRTAQKTFYKDIISNRDEKRQEKAEEAKTTSSIPLVGKAKAVKTTTKKRKGAKAKRVKIKSFKFKRRKVKKLKIKRPKKLRLKI